MLTEHIEVEGVYVVVQGLVVEEQLRNETQVLAVSLLILCINLEEGDRIISIDLIAWWVSDQAALTMSDEL